MPIDLSKIKLDIYPQSGQTVPLNAVDSGACYGNGAHDFAAALINVGGPEGFAWRYRGNTAGTNAIYSSSIGASLQATVDMTNTADPGVTVALRYRIVTPKSSGTDFRSHFQIANSTTTSGEGAFLSILGGPAASVGYGSASALSSPTNISLTANTWRTIVFRVTPSATFGADQLDIWLDGGSGSSPDQTDTGNDNSATLLAILFKEITSLAGETSVEFAREVLYRGTSALPNADCRSLATDIYAALTPSGPVLTSPIGVATGNTTSTAGFTTDQAVSGALPAYFLTLAAATAAPADAATLIANGATVSQTTGGTTPTRALTALTTNTAVRTHMCQPGSNVVSSASYTPPTMASSGSLSAQSGVAGAAFTWTGPTPASQITVPGVGTLTWTGSGLGASGLTINSSTGILQGTCGTAGNYTVTDTDTDQSTAGTNPTGGGAPPQTIVRSISLTISAPAGGPTINTHPSNQTAQIGASATFTVAATTSGGTLLYQWRLAGSPISGATSATYVRTGVVLGDHAGVYTCAVTDNNGTTVSNSATLTVAVTFSGTVPSFSGVTGASGSIDLSSYFAGGLTRTFALFSGAMPTGLTQVGTTAVWTGTLGAVGSGTYVVRSTDSASNVANTNTAAWTISANTPGTITSEPLANNDKVLLPNKALTWIGFRTYSNGASVLVVTGVSTNSSAQFSVNNAALTPGVRYLIDWLTVDGDHGRAAAYAV